MIYINKMKCMHCSLHFAAYSWQEDWHPVTCPECKAKFDEVGGYLHWREVSHAQIYNFVPGHAGINSEVLRTAAVAANDTDNE